MKRRLLASLLTLVMVLSLLPTVAWAGNEEPLKVLLIGNSHTVDMTEWTDLVLRDSGLENKIQITPLTPMGGRKLFTDDTVRSSHITAATWKGTDAEWAEMHPGENVGANKRYYDAQLSSDSKTWDLVVVQD